MSLIDHLKKQVLKSQVWKSIFRHDYKDTQRNRFLQILDNVFLHPPGAWAASRSSCSWCSP